MTLTILILKILGAFAFVVLLFLVAHWIGKDCDGAPGI